MTIGNNTALQNLKFAKRIDLVLNVFIIYTKNKGGRGSFGTAGYIYDVDCSLMFMI